MDYSNYSPNYRVPYLHENVNSLPYRRQNVYGAYEAPETYLPNYTDFITPNRKMSVRQSTVPRRNVLYDNYEEYNNDYRYGPQIPFGYSKIASYGFGADRFMGGRIDPPENYTEYNRQKPENDDDYDFLDKTPDIPGSPAACRMQQKINANCTMGSLPPYHYNESDPRNDPYSSWRLPQVKQKDLQFRRSSKLWDQ